MAAIRSTMIALALFGAAGAEAARRTRVRAPQLAVVSVGTEPGLRLGEETLSRPFGGDLVGSIAVVSRHTLPGRTAWLVRGDGGADCPARYVVVTKTRAEPLAVTSPFGTCAAGAYGQVQRGTLVVSMAGPDGYRASWDWTGGAMRAVTPAAQANAGVTGACAVDAARPDLLEASLWDVLPPELRRRGDLRRSAIDAESMQGIVAELACLSTWPGADPKVAKAAEPLFASKQHGRHAFAALETIARTPAAGVDLRAAVRSFSARMVYQIGQREPI